MKRGFLSSALHYNINAFWPRPSGRRPLLSFTVDFFFLLILLAYFPYLEKNKRTFMRLPYCLCIPLPPISFSVFCAVWVASNGSRQLVLPRTVCCYYSFVFHIPHYFLSLFFLIFFSLILLFFLFILSSLPFPSSLLHPFFVTSVLA